MSPLLIAFALVVQTPDAPAPAPAAVEEPAAKKAKPKKICREKAEQTGSRMRGKECRTAEEWARRDSGATISDLESIGTR